MGRQERERKARQNPRNATGAEGGAGPAGSSEGDAPSPPNAVSLFPAEPSPGELHGDARMLQRAITERWPSAAQKRAAIRAKLQNAILSDDVGPTPLLATLVNADARLEAQNLADDRRFDPFTGLPVAPSGGGEAPGGEGELPPATYQQINFYIPSNGRGQEPAAGPDGDG